MRHGVAGLALCLALACSACGAPQLSLSSGGTRGWADSSSWPWYRERDAWRGYGSSRYDDPSVVCDSFGRCWHRRHLERPDAEPPGWAENLPGSARRDDRFLRPRAELVCDRTTRICYKDGFVDKSDTERVFGERAADRADDLRDRLGTPRVFVPEQGVACDRDRRLCLDDGDADRSLTRRYFGRRAARDLDEERPRDDDAKRNRKRATR